MHDFTPIESTIGGLLVGLSAALLLLFHGRIAGISGIFGGLLSKGTADVGWRMSFVLGLLLTGFAASLLAPSGFAMDIERSTAAIMAAGLLVGFGTRIGSGCTSGHGVCGVSRASPRSLIATGTFMVTGAATAAIITHAFGGAL